MEIVKPERAFLPAAGRDIFLPLYDPITRLLGVDTAREELLAQANLQPSQRVLDVGCGTGTLALLIKRRHPTVDVVGVDPDPKALARARMKAQRAGVSIRFDRGYADALGYADGAFDRVFSSMMFHHLPAEMKAPALREIHRVLRGGGELELLDFAGPHAHAHGPFARLIHSHRQLRDNDERRVLALMEEAGFTPATLVRERGSFFGRLAYYQARHAA